MRAIGIVLAGGNSKRMREYPIRAIAAMPIAGSYRSVDFALSNMSNSHTSRVWRCSTQHNRSLNIILSSFKW